MSTNEIEALRQHIGELLDQLSAQNLERDALKSSLQRAKEENDVLDQDNFALRLQNSFLECNGAGVKQLTSELEEEVFCAMHEAFAARDDLARVKREAAVAQGELVREATEYKKRATSAAEEANNLGGMLMGATIEVDRIRRENEKLVRIRREYEELVRVAWVMAGALVLLGGYFWFRMLSVLCGL